MVNIMLNITLPNKKILLAISGGVDSMVLLDYFIKNHNNFEVAHFDHQIREDSYKDYMLIKQIAQQHNIKLHFQSKNIKSLSNGKSIETVAREHRYNFLNEIYQNGFDLICLAHHKNDAAETLLMNLMRGSSIHGCSSIKEYNNHYYRPFMSISKNDILNYAKEHSIEWNEDYTNSIEDCDRNKIRHSILPDLETIKPGTLNNFNNFIQHAQKLSNFLIKEANKYIKNNSISLEDYYNLDEVLQEQICYNIWINVFGSSSNYNKKIKDSFMAHFKKSKNGIKANVNGVAFINKNGTIHFGKSNKY